MVARALRQPAPSTPAQETEKHSTTVRLTNVLDAGGRIDASAFGIERRNAVEAVKSNTHGAVALYGPKGIAIEAHNAFRFRRIFVQPDYGIPFLTSSDIIALKLETDRFLSQTKTKRLAELLIRQWDVLISCSGTVGNVALAGEGITGMALSQDALRVRFSDPDQAGYISGFLRSRYGRPQLTGAAYGSVVTHIEPEHLHRVWVPDLPKVQWKKLGAAMRQATALRDDANDLLDEADALLHKRLGLKPLPPVSPDSETNTVRASNLAGRFEASYHNQRAAAANDVLNGIGIELTTVGDPRVSAEVRAITRFRKRTYVQTGGVPMLNSKQLFQVDPVVVKRLALGAHKRDVEREIGLEGNMLAVTSGGSLGRIQIIPQYMTGWTANQHSIRIVAASDSMAGYLYSWLASDYGQALILRQSYGSVIQHIDLGQLSSVPIPYPKKKVCDDVGSLVLTANNLRDKAWRVERKTIEKIESLIEG